MKKKLAILIFIIVELLLVFIEKKYLNGFFGEDRFILLSLVNVFCCCHLFFDISRMYDFIYKIRYVIATFLLIFCCIQGYHGSSVSLWNNVIQPNNYVESGSVVLGVTRGIRGDEYFVTTPYASSQVFNDFNAKSDILMGREGYVTMFPRLPCKSIAILGNLHCIPYLFLPFENAFALSWFLKVALIFFASFELCMLISNNKRLYSLMGAVLITFSGASCWWSNMGILAWGAFAIVVMKLFLKSKNKLSRFFYSIIMGLVGANYLMDLYPAWQVPFGYLCLGFFIWLWIENKKNLNFKMLLYVPIVLAVMFGIFLPVFIESYDIYLQTISTLYPGKRLSIGGSGSDRLIAYYLSLFFGVKEFFNPCEYSNFMSFYPLPIISSIVIFIKNIKKKIKVDSLLIILSIVAILLSIWNYIELPVWLSKVTLLSFSTPERCQLVVGYICIFIIIRIMSLYEYKGNIFNKKLLLSLLVSLLFNVGVILLVNSYFDEYLTKGMIMILMVVFVPIVTLIILNNEKTNKILAILLVFVSFFTGMIINPIAKGVGVLTDKPVSKEIQEIVSNNEESRWLVVNNNYALPNFVIANGARTINSTYFYPNLELWKKFDPKGENEFIYNRYAHVKFKITDKDTNFELLYPDSFQVNLNVADLDKLNANYILTDYSIDEYLINIADCIYDKDGIYIYEINN